MDTEEFTAYRIEGYADDRWHLLRPMPEGYPGTPEKNLAEVIEVLRERKMARYTKVRCRKIVVTESTEAEVVV